MTISDKFILTGDLECYWCGETKPAILFGENPDIGMCICKDCLIECVKEIERRE